MSVLVGVDAGGTRTTALAADADGRESRARGPGAAVRPGRPGGAMAAGAVIAATVREALRGLVRLRADVLVVGAAGAGREAERQALRDALRIEDLAERLVVTGDLEIAREAAFGDGPGVVLLAGTGSVCAGRTPDGEERRSGGYGWQLGDEGSGYALGRAALGAVSRGRDGRGPATALTDPVLQATRSADFAALIRWSAGASPGEVAGLAPVVLGLAANDPVARELAATGAHELASHLEALLRDWPGAGPVPIALGGGLFQDPGYREAVVERLRSLPRAALRPEPLDPVRGALRLAASLSP